MKFAARFSKNSFGLVAKSGMAIGLAIGLPWIWSSEARLKSTAVEVSRDETFTAALDQAILTEKNIGNINKVVSYLQDYIT